ncbi:TIGR04013 family B12-binding domain/radical SAM domain-containing protein [bacterium]|nr:TIGR04013 family B12-binding domain/radical SAM domain-containing protein [bacterium]
MSANSSSFNEPAILFRIQNYNCVSAGALLGACQVHGVSDIRPLFWKGDSHIPKDVFSNRVLFIYSFMALHVKSVENEIQTLKKLARQGVDGEGEEIFPWITERWLKEKLSLGLITSKRDSVDIDRYPGFHFSTGYLPPIEITRGCTYCCTFCAVPRLYGGTIRHRSVAGVVSIVESYLRLKPDRKRIKFLSPNAFAYGSKDGRTPNFSALHELLSALKKMGVPEICLGSFPSEVRPDFVTKELLDLVVPFLSNRVIVMGAQTYNDEKLKEMHRYHDRADVEKAIQLLRKYGFVPHVDFIIGLPGETFEEQDKLLTFFETLVREYGIRIHLHTFMPLPGTPWERYSPAPIGETARRGIQNLSSAKVLDGWWDHQIAYGRGKL